MMTRSRVLAEDCRDRSGDSSGRTQDVDGKGAAHAGGGRRGWWWRASGKGRSCVERSGIAESSNCLLAFSFFFSTAMHGTLHSFFVCVARTNYDVCINSIQPWIIGVWAGRCEGSQSPPSLSANDGRRPDPAKRKELADSHPPLFRMDRHHASQRINHKE